MGKFKFESKKMTNFVHKIVINKFNLHDVVYYIYEGWKGVIRGHDGN
jgi:hypothetical protein